MQLQEDGFKHYVVDFKNATFLDRREVNKILKSFKHPENWEVVKMGNTAPKKQEEYKYIRNRVNRREN